MLQCEQIFAATVCRQLAPTGHLTFFGLHVGSTFKTVAHVSSSASSDVVKLTLCEVPHGILLARFLRFPHKK